MVAINSFGVYLCITSDSGKLVKNKKCENNKVETIMTLAKSMEKKRDLEWTCKTTMEVVMGDFGSKGIIDIK